MVVRGDPATGVCLVFTISHLHAAPVYSAESPCKLSPYSIVVIHANLESKWELPKETSKVGGER